MLLPTVVLGLEVEVAAELGLVGVGGGRLVKLLSCLSCTVESCHQLIKNRYYYPLI